MAFLEHFHTFFDDAGGATMCEGRHTKNGSKQDYPRHYFHRYLSRHIFKNIHSDRSLIFCDHRPQQQIGTH